MKSREKHALFTCVVLQTFQFNRFMAYCKKFFSAQMKTRAVDLTGKTRSTDVNKI